MELSMFFHSLIFWHFVFETVPPMLWIPNQLESAYLGQDVMLECHIEAYPKSINYWTTAKGDMIISGNNSELVLGPSSQLVSRIHPNKNEWSRENWFVDVFQVKSTNRFHRTIPIGCTCASRSAKSAGMISARTSASPRTPSEKPTAPSNFTVKNFSVRHCSLTNSTVTEIPDPVTTASTGSSKHVTESIRHIKKKGKLHYHQLNSNDFIVWLGIQTGKKSERTINTRECRTATMLHQEQPITVFLAFNYQKKLLSVHSI